MRSNPRERLAVPARASSAGDGGQAEPARADAATGPRPAEPPFAGILWPASRDKLRDVGAVAPDCFRDLGLDRIVDGVVAAWKEYELAPFFRVPPDDLDTIRYRQDVFRDLENAGVRESVETFARQMRAMRMRREHARKLEYRAERERWFVESVLAYCDGVAALAAALPAARPHSHGLRSFAAYAAAYARSPRFVSLAARARRVIDDLAAVRYELRIHGGSATVLPSRDSADYTAAVAATFERFRRTAVKDYHTRLREPGRLGHVEARIIARVERLHPAPFAALSAFHAEEQAFVDEAIARFDREVHFYLAYLAHIEPLRRASLAFCYPELSDSSKAVDCAGTFDLALAAKLVLQGGAVVPNDVRLDDGERILVVSGPNQGGKTTFARTFGQLLWLARLGCPVPGTRARLFLFDRIFVHFERDERVETLRGKLQDDLVRIRDILAAATPRSIIILNEIFSSTTLDDAVLLGRRLMAAISRLDALALCVTFLDDLARFDAKTVSVVGAVDPRDPAVRTFRFERRPPDGLAYALAVAEKHRVTYDWLVRRLRA